MESAFRPQQRLLTAEDYRRVFAAPEHRAGQQELLMLARTNGLPRHRLGLAVAKKHIPLAVDRNTFKRLAREQFRMLPQRPPCLDIVILTRQGANRADKSQLRGALERQFSRLGIRDRA